MKQAVNDGYFELTPGFETPDWGKGSGYVPDNG